MKKNPHRQPLSLLPPDLRTCPGPLRMVNDASACSGPVPKPRRIAGLTSGWGLTFFGPLSEGRDWNGRYLPHLAHLDMSGAGRARLGAMGSTCPRASTPSPAARRAGATEGRRPGEGLSAWRQGGRPAGSAGAGAGEGGWRASSIAGGRSWPGKVQCVQLFLVCQRPRAVGAPLPGGSPGEGRRPGGRRRKDADRMRARGASPRGEDGEPAVRRARERGPGRPLGGRWHP